MPLPSVISPKDVALQFGISERRVRNDARKTGLCHIVGNRMFLTEDDVAGLLEHWRPVVVTPSKAGAPEFDYAALLRLRAQQRKDAQSPGRTAKRIADGKEQRAQGKALL